MGYLRWLIQKEGECQSWDEVPEDVRVVARQLGYEEGMKLVLTLYKPACRCRQAPNGINLNAGSLQMFSSFVRACEDIASKTTSDNRIIRALLLHNAGSASAPHNGNASQGTTVRQVEFNLRAKDILEAIPDMDRDDDWQCVWEKVMVALYETRAIPFVQDCFYEIIGSMERHGSKDAAGRREFLAKWLDGRGRPNEAIEILKPVKMDATSDPTQRNRALELLKKLTPGIVAIFLLALQFAPRFAVAFQ